MDSIEQDANQQQNSKQNLHQVKDPISILKLLIIFLAVLSVLIWFDLNYRKLGLSPLFFLSHLVIVPIFLRLKVIWRGVELDTNALTMEFPGGSISANGFGDYFSPSWLLQYFSRKKIDLDSVGQISRPRKYKNKKGLPVLTHHGVQLVGSFGAASIWFKDESKRDQIFSLIRQVNHMGEAVIRA